jgi:zinc protease
MASSAPEDFHKLLAPLVAEGPVEVVIVGDVNLEKAISTAAATVGAMPARAEDTPPADATKVAFPKPTPRPIVLTHKGRADQALAYIAWPANDFFSNPHDARTLRVLAQVLELRLIDDLRETMGATYSPQAAAAASLTYPGYGYVYATAEVPPGKLDAFFEDADKIATALRQAPPSEDELERARKPLVENLMRLRQTNEYWLEQLSGAQADPRRLEALRTVLPTFRKVSAADVQAVAETYLDPAKAFRIEVVPQAQAKTIAAAGR